MMRLVVLAALLAALSACREDEAALPGPVEMTAESTGYYCQMNLLEHQGPKGQVHLDGMPAPLFFSQVRDAVAYLRMPEQSHAVVAAYVQDMTGATWKAPGPWIALTGAVFVVGSDARGGMGAPEMVPFSDRAAAEDFARSHGGAVMAYADIPGEIALAAADRQPEGAATDQDDMRNRLRALSKNQGN